MKLLRDVRLPVDLKSRGGTGPARCASIGVNTTPCGPGATEFDVACNKLMSRNTGSKTIERVYARVSRRRERLDPFAFRIETYAHLPEIRAALERMAGEDAAAAARAKIPQEERERVEREERQAAIRAFLASVAGMSSRAVQEATGIALPHRGALAGWRADRHTRRDAAAHAVISNPEKEPQTTFLTQRRRVRRETQRGNEFSACSASLREAFAVLVSEESSRRLPGPFRDSVSEGVPLLPLLPLRESKAAVEVLRELCVSA